MKETVEVVSSEIIAKMRTKGQLDFEISE